MTNDLKNNIKVLSKNFFTIQTISADYFLALQKAYEENRFDLENFINYDLDVKSINIEAFSSTEQLAKVFKDITLEALHNFEQIETHIILPILNVQNNYGGSWEAFKEEAQGWNEADDEYNLQKGN